MEGRQRRKWILVHMSQPGHLTDIARGVLEFVKTRRELGAFVAHGQHDYRSWLNKRDLSGMITNMPQSELAQELQELGVPTVLAEHDPREGYPIVRGDDLKIGRLAFDHLHSLGIRRFAYWGTRDMYYCRLRARGFLQAAVDAGCEAYTRVDYGVGKTIYSEAEMNEFDKWIRRLPLPLGLFVHTSFDSLRCASHCDDLEILIPEQIAVLGVDDNELFCDAVTPTLSAIDQGCHRIGYHAAELIWRMMCGETVENEVHLIPPTGVTKRQSTDYVAIESPYAATAYHFIQEHACDGIGVNDVAASVSVSRRTLETHFRKAFGRTIHDEILRVRLERAKQLLKNSRLELGMVALECGFSWQGVFSNTFKKFEGMNPSDYRKRALAGTISG